MTLDEARRLLPGYATGTLDEAQRKALFTAALEHQELFEELMEEQPLLELLADPDARAELIEASAPELILHEPPRQVAPSPLVAQAEPAAITPTPAPKRPAILWWAAAAATVTTIAIGVALWGPQQNPTPVAKVDPPAITSAPAPAPSVANSPEPASTQRSKQAAPARRERSVNQTQADRAPEPEAAPVPVPLAAPEVANTEQRAEAKTTAAPAPLPAVTKEELARQAFADQAAEASAARAPAAPAAGVRGGLQALYVLQVTAFDATTKEPVYLNRPLPPRPIELHFATPAPVEVRVATDPGPYTAELRLRPGSRMITIPLDTASTSIKIQITAEVQGNGPDRFVDTRWEIPLQPGTSRRVLTVAK